MSVKGFKLSNGNVVRYDYSSLDNIVTDSTLSLTGVAADAKAVGDELDGVKQELQELINRGGGTGLTDIEKSLILTLFNQAAYAENGADTAYNQLSNLWSEYSITWSGSGYTHSNNSSSITGGSTFTSTISASSGFTIMGVVATMGGNTVQGAWQNGTVTIPNVTGNIVITVTTAQATVSSISAVYTQSGQVYDNTPLDNLKTDLVVTAHYVDSTTYVVPSTDYTLTGTLAIGTSAVTVTYSGKTTTFNVTVSDSQAWTDGNPYNTEMFLPKTDNTYLLEASGAEAAYNGWNASNYVNCGGASALVFSTSLAYNYCIFYDTSKTYIAPLQRFNNSNTLAIPPNTKYFRLSDSNANMTKVYGGMTTITPFIYEAVDILTGIIPNTYLASNGNEASTQDWSATDFIDISEYSSIRVYRDDGVTATFPDSYCYWYDANKTKIDSMTGISQMYNNTSKIVAIPQGAVYFRLSATTAVFTNTIHVEAK